LNFIYASPHICGVPQMIRQTTGVIAPLQNKEKTSQQCMFADTEFFRYSSTMCWPQSFRFWSMGMLETSNCIHLQLKMERHLINTIFRPVKPLKITLGPWRFARVHDSTCPYVQLFRWKIFLSICCKLWLDKQ